MLLPDFERLFLMAIKATSLIYVMTALAPITQSTSDEYVGEPRIMVKKDSVMINIGDGLHVIFGEQRATELLIQAMLEMDDLHAIDLQPFREAAAKVGQAKNYILTYELQKANLAKLVADEGLWEQVEAKFETSISLVGNSAEVEEWRVLLTNYTVQEISETVLKHDDHAHQLRLFSPASGFLSETEQSEIYATVMGEPLPTPTNSG
ncbi:hypothetical protein [Pseudomonas abietaniphila]|uniref:Uncharacterized protein n=1 Tax=Pseudomonas abietaniphila TaxID=89065 RepID=A0A1G8SGE9_9PSED|nr:hypothetical protein [Pseudomonas abietaniphila]SDJ27740.1 hypothetical protein SAMN05216605_12521 [Pseudomonas abietaniphila]